MEENKTIRLLLVIFCLMWLLSLAGGFILEWRQQELSPPDSVIATEHDTP